MVKVIVYGTTTCPHCHHAKDFLKKNNIDFESFDVDTDEKAKNEMVEKSGQMGVPVIFVDDDMIVGFDEAKLKEKLNIE